MIDLNNIINDAITKAVNQAVEAHIRVRAQALATRHTRQREVMRDLIRRIGFLEEQVQVYSRRIEFLEACAAGGQGAVPNSVDELEKRLNTLRLQLEHRIEEGDRESASYAALEALQKQVDSLQRQVTAIDEANSKDAERFHEDVKAIVAGVLNEGLAEAVADAFQNGSLTISVDKV